MLPDGIRANQLERGARRELTTLTAENADAVARHLVMAGILIDEDPALAHRHALAASQRGGRVAVVRETLGITAYATGDFALALRELRTFRRLSGSDDQLALMIDSERGVGRPERALELGRSVVRSTLPVLAQVSVAIAMSGAHLDLGDTERALLELEIPQLDPDRAFEYSPALFDAYAAVLTEVGRGEEAATWATRAERAADALDARDAAGETLDVVEERLPVDDADADAEDTDDDAALVEDGSPLDEDMVADPDAPDDDAPVDEDLLLASDDVLGEESGDAAPVDADVVDGADDEEAGASTTGTGVLAEAADPHADGDPADAVPDVPSADDGEEEHGVPHAQS